MACGKTLNKFINYTVTIMLTQSLSLGLEGFSAEEVKISSEAFCKCCEAIDQANALLRNLNVETKKQLTLKLSLELAPKSLTHKRD